MKSTFQLILLVISSALFSQTAKQLIDTSDVKAYNGDYVGAKVGYDKVLQKDPNNAICLYKRGLAIIKIGDNIDDAINDFTKAIKIKPKYSDAY
jgi:tetratricopeptide (TPR) repeat protein